MCGRGICKPKVFCTLNCKEYWNSGFRVELGYDNLFTVNDWIVIVPTPEYHKGEAYLG